MSGDRTTPLDRLLVDVAGGATVQFDVQASWFRLTDDPPPGSRVTFPGGPSGGVALTGGRVYALACVVDCLAITWGPTTPLFQARTLELEFGIGQAPSATRVLPAVGRCTLLAQRTTTVPSFGAGPEGTTLTWSPFLRWRSTVFDGVTFPLMGAWGDSPRKFAVYTRAATAGRAYALWIGAEHPTLGGPAAVVPIAGPITSTARPTGFEWAATCLECNAGSVQVGFSILGGGALNIYGELWEVL